MEKDEFKIIDITEDGKGIAKKDSLVYFIKNSNLGDIVSIKNTENKGKYLIAEKDKVLKENKFKIKSKCKYFPNCENCVFQNLKYEKELEFKENKVINNLKRIGKINLENVKISKIEKSYYEFNYRNKINLKIKDGKIGYNKRKSNEIINIDRCEIADEKINEIIKIIANSKNINLKWFNSLMIRCLDNKAQLKFGLDEKTKEKENKKIKEQEEKLYKELEEKTNIKILGDKLNIKFLDYKININSKSFFQINQKQAEKIYKEINNELEKENPSKNNVLIDLYSGVGISSIIFSKLFKKIISIEINKESTKAAELNSKANNIKNIEFLNGKAEDLIENLKIEKNSYVFFDPPRAGLEKNIINKIAENKLKNIIYMSCNSATLARDLKLFIDKGYKLKKIKIYDMFPKTLHVETIALLSKLDVDKHIDIQIGLDEMDLTSAESKATGI